MLGVVLQNGCVNGATMLSKRGSEVGILGIALLEWAATEGRVLITIDQDFGEIIFSENARHAGLIRLPDVPAEKRIELIEGILSSRSAEILERSVVTVRGGRVRISLPPPLKGNPPKK